MPLLPREEDRRRVLHRMVMWADPRPPSAAEFDEYEELADRRWGALFGYLDPLMGEHGRPMPEMQP